MARSKVHYQGLATGRGASPLVWGDCPVQDFQDDPTRGYLFYDDFHNLPPSGSKYTILEADDKASLSILPTDVQGILRMAITGDDNEECNFQYGVSGESVQGIFNTPANDARRMWFEARFRTSSIANNVNALFLGMAAEGSCAANAQSDNNGTLWDSDDSGTTDKAHFCFRTLQADGDGLDIEYGTAGAISVVHKNLAQVLVANTWYKVAWKQDEDGLVQCFIDNVKSGSVLDVSATSVPDGEELAFVAGCKVGGDAALNVDIDWVRFAQEFIQP